MATTKFYLTRPTAKEKTTIYFLFSYGAFQLLPNGKKKYLPLKYYTTLSVNPDQWDIKKGWVLKPSAKNGRINASEYEEMNTALKNIVSTTENLLRRLENDGKKLTNDLLSAELDTIYKGHKDTKSMDTDNLLTFVEKFISVCDRKPLTIKGYRQTLRELRDYSTKQNKSLTFDAIDLDFYLDFVDFLTGKEYAPNTVGTRIKDLKMLMNEAYDRGLHTNLDFKKKRFKKPSEETFSVYLNNDELLKIYNLKLGNAKKLEKIRDLFMIGCYTVVALMHNLFYINELKAGKPKLVTI